MASEEEIESRQAARSPADSDGRTTASSAPRAAASWPLGLATHCRLEWIGVGSCSSSLREAENTDWRCHAISNRGGGLINIKKNERGASSCLWHTVFALGLMGSIYQSRWSGAPFFVVIWSSVGEEFGSVQCRFRAI
jgi:hypothetical protein